MLQYSPPTLPQFTQETLNALIIISLSLSSSPSSSFACEQALHLWDIMKSRRLSGDMKVAAGGQKDELAMITH